MPVGSSSLMSIKQQPPAMDIVFEDSYYQIKLAEAQAYFDMPFLAKPAALLVNSVVESSFYPEQPVNSMHKVNIVQKGVTCKLPFNTNLTDWLPARNTDQIKITMAYTLLVDEPFKKLVDQMQKTNLSAVISKVRLEWGMALKISEFVGRLLSFLLEEGKAKKLFEIQTTLNLSELKPGFHAVVGTPDNRLWPVTLVHDQRGFYDEEARLQHVCYALFKVNSIPRKGIEVARNETWWELLQTSKDAALSTLPKNKSERQKIMGEWNTALRRVRELSRKNTAFLLSEIEQIIHSAHIELENTILPKIQEEGMVSTKDLPEVWREVLYIDNHEQLYHSARDYQDALEVTKRLLTIYDE
jgi:hypothetical protein